MTPKPCAVSIKDLVKRYQGAHSAQTVEALRGLNLTIKAGESVAITGPSGCGKTTLLNLLGALDKATSGQLEVFGHKLSTLNSRQRAEYRRNTVGTIFQQFHLIPTLTAWENIALPLKYAGISVKERKQRAHASLERVGLKDRSEHFPAMMSGGEQQRVAVARALVSGTKLLLCDEPTGNLDHKTAQDILNLLTSTLDQGLTLIVVTHDLELARRLSRTVRLRDGQIESDS